MAASTNGMLVLSFTVVDRSALSFSWRKCLTVEFGNHVQPRGAVPLAHDTKCRSVVAVMTRSAFLGLKWQRRASAMFLSYGKFS